MDKIHQYAKMHPDELLESFHASKSGLSSSEATSRLEKYGYNDPSKKKKHNILFEFLSRFLNPLVITLVFISVFSLIFGEKISALIVGVMAFLSVVISYIQEYKANKDAEQLIDMVRITADVIRDGKITTIRMREVVPGDIIDLSAGDMIPADLRIITAKDLFLNQATFTGEAFPVEKFADINAKDIKNSAGLDNIALMGASVVSGTALGIVLATGSLTELGKMSSDLDKTEPPTAFDRGIKDFTMMMIRSMIILAIAVFAINALAKQNFVEAFMFALAVAVGLAPEMLPMEVTLNLTKGAIKMSKKEVIVKRLDSIQNFGAMDILCTDKTGTLTIDDIVLVKHMNALGEEDEDVLRYAYLNSYYQTGLHNVLDAAVLKHEHLAIKTYRKIDEIPFDFERRVMSVIVAWDHHTRIITKGAPEEMFKRCKQFEAHEKIHHMTKETLHRLEEKYRELSSQGFRVLAIGFNNYTADKKNYGPSDEQELIFKGFIAFLDPAKPTAEKTIRALENLGIRLKILSGDNELVTRKICNDVKLEIEGMLNGDDIEKMSDRELAAAVEKNNIFTRLNPLQKERVIKAMQQNKHIIGYMGDGINDAPALKAADVGISVNNAVAVAKEMADIILMRKSLSVLVDCVKEGRTTFGNIIKYIKMGSSSNFGNMFSMTGASLLLPFLPMKPIHILFNNFLYDISQVTLSADDVDEEYVKKPRRWDIGFIKKFMVFIGPISSVFDYLTFAVMWFIFGATTTASQAVFQTGWFLESLTTQTLVIYIIRTNRKPFIQSWPNRLLMISTVGTLVFAHVFANSPYGYILGFTPMPWQFYLILTLMVIFYLGIVQLVKVWFIRKFDH